MQTVHLNIDIRDITDMVDDISGKLSLSPTIKLDKYNNILINFDPVHHILINPKTRTMKDKTSKHSTKQDKFSRAFIPRFREYVRGLK